MSSKPGKKFDRDSKRNAVLLCAEPGRSVPEAAERPGIGKDPLYRRRREYHQANGQYVFPGNVVAGRIANRFNLSGTNSVSDGACASSMSAIHTAVMELAVHKGDMSVTGGVDCLNDIFMHMCFARTGVLSHTSDARHFSKDADGTVLGEGIGMLVLKRLEDVQKDRDRIYAVIRAVGTSSDGRTSAIYAPEVASQLKALTNAYSQAHIDPATVGLVEAHGTGTRAGVSAFGFGGSNFHAVLEEHAPAKTQVSWDGAVQIAAFSANDAQALLKRLAAFEDQITPAYPADDGKVRQLIARQAQESRKTFRHDHPYRLLMVLHKEDDPARLLERAGKIIKKGAPSAGPVYYGSGPVQIKPGFLFPGQGSQYLDMGKDLFAAFPEAMEVLCLAQKIYNEYGHDCRSRNDVSPDLTDQMFAPPPYLQDRATSETRLRHTRVAQVAIGAVSLAMTLVLRRFGIRPHMTCGHSFGELTAMHAAGWMDDHTLLTLAAVRGRHMASAGDSGSDRGSMLAVQAPLADIETLIRNLELDLVLANRNSPDQGVLSGPTPDIDQARQWCKSNRIRAVKLPVAAAFHSRLVADAATPFSRFVAEQTIVPTDIAVLSNTTGTAYDTDPEKIKELLGHQLMYPVRFQQNIETMHHHGVNFFLEVGPKTVLTGLTKRILASEPVTAISMDASGGRKSGILDLAHTLCHLASCGVAVDLTQWEGPGVRPGT